MTNDITPELLKQYHEVNKLGKLQIPQPHDQGLTVWLDHLYRHATGLEFFEYETQPENIEAIVLFGSTLYKHFPRETVTHTRRKYGLFGPVITEERERLYRLPNDVDIMVITEQSFTDDKVIKPTKKEILVPGGIFGPINEYVHSPVEGIELALDNYGYYGVKTGRGLHVSYRSTEQLLAGLREEDTVSRSVVEYGVPIIGAARFEEIVHDVQDPIREPLHTVYWEEDMDGILGGTIE